MQPGAAGIYLASTLIQLYATLLIFRLLLEWVKADYYNPVCQAVIRMTAPVLDPLRKRLPSWGWFDLATVLVILLLECTVVWLSYLGVGVEFNPVGILYFAILRSIQLLLMTFLVLIVVNVLLAMFGQQLRHPIIPLVFAITEPVLNQVRRVIKPTAGLDFSPLIVIIAILTIMVLLGLR